MTKECLSFSRTAPERFGSWQGRGKESETSCQMTLHIFPTTAMSCMWEVVCSILSFARQRWYGRLAYYVIVPAGLIGLWQGKRGACLQIAQSRMRRGVLIVGFVFLGYFPWPDSERCWPLLARSCTKLRWETPFGAVSGTDTSTQPSLPAGQEILHPEMCLYNLGTVFVSSYSYSYFLINVNWRRAHHLNPLPAELRWYELFGGRGRGHWSVFRPENSKQWQQWP